MLSDISDIFFLFCNWVSILKFSRHYVKPQKQFCCTFGNITLAKNEENHCYTIMLCSWFICKVGLVFLFYFFILVRLIPSIEGLNFLPRSAISWRNKHMYKCMCNSLKWEIVNFILIQGKHYVTRTSVLPPLLFKFV